MSDQSTIDLLIADAYRDASLHGVDMRSLAADVESMAPALRTPHALGTQWRAITSSIAARHPDDALTSVLVTLRERLFRNDLAERLAQIDDLAAHSPADAERHWTATLADAAVELWSVAVREVGGWAEGRPFLDSDLGAQARAAAELFDARRYPETWDLLHRLAHDERIGASTRLDLHHLLAQIAVYRLDDVATWRAVYADAAAIDGGDPRLLMMEADLEGKRSEWATTDGGRASHLATAEHLLDQADASPRLDDDDRGLLHERRGDLRVRAATLALGAGDQARVEDEWARAEEHYRDAMAVAPWSVGHVSSLAAQLVRSGARPHDAEVAQLTGLAHLMVPATNATNAETMIAAALFEVGRIDEASELFGQVLEIAPGNIDAIQAYAALLLATDQDVVGWLADVEARLPGTYEVAQAQAWIAESQQRYGDAEAHYLTALERRPRAEPSIRADLAWVLQQRGEGARATAEAIAACQLLIERDDRDSPAIVPATARLLDASDVLVEQGEIEQALAHLDTVSELRGPSFDADLRNRRGVAFHSLQRFDDAIIEYRLSTEHDPAAAVVWDNLSLALRQTGDFDGAADAVERASALTGDEDARRASLAAIANLRGNAAVARSDQASAAAAYREAVTHAPADPVILSNLAQVLLEDATHETIEANVDEAVDVLQRAVEHGGETYEDDLRWARRARDVAHLLGGWVLLAKPPARLRAVMPRDLVPLIADADGSVLASVDQRLEDSTTDVGYGLGRSGVIFSVGPTAGPTTVRITINGRNWRDVELHDDAQPIVDAIDELTVERADAFVGPDQVAGLVARAGRLDLADATDDPGRFADLIRALRAGAGRGATLDSVIPQQAAKL